MIAVALKGLAARKVRAALTAIAIVLGVAMVSGTFILTDTVDKAFDEIFVATRQGTSVVITGKKVVERSLSGGATVPQELVAEVRRQPGVAAAGGSIEDRAKIIGRDGKAVSTFGPPTLGYGLDFSQPRFNILELEDGRWPAGSNEVAIDKATADKEGFKVGDTVGVAPRGRVERFKLTALAGVGGLESLGGATIAAFDIPTAAKLFEKEGQLTSISVLAKKGVAPEQLARDLRPLLPANVEAKTAAEQAESDATAATQGVNFLRYALLAFGGIAVFVGAFVIFNTISITVAQRTREFAMLRTIGATRRQILVSVILEALTIGVIASLAGLFLGLALAAGLNALLVAAGVDTPKTGTVFAARTVVVSLALGVGVAVAASLAPALRATRVPPIAAVREGATLPRSRLAPFAPHIAAIAVLAAVVLIVYATLAADLGTALRLGLLAFGCLVLFVGVALLSSRFVRPLASLLGRPSERLAGIAGRLARDNSVRNPSRTAATAAALMIGLALVSFVAVLGDGLRSSVVDTIEEQVRSDYVVSSQSRLEPFPAAAGDAVADAPGVAVASDVRGDLAKVGSTDRDVTGLDAATIATVYRFEWRKGSDAVLSRLGGRGAIVTDAFADNEGLDVGDRFRVLTPDSNRLELEVRAIYRPPALGSLLGDVSISKAAFDAGFPTPRNLRTFLKVTGGPGAASRRVLEQTLAEYPEAKLQTQPEFISDQEASISQLLGLLYVLLALSGLISVFGMVNTLALSITERTRELGLLRAVGMTRRQVRRMVRHESMITALIGAALGLPLGVFLGALVTRALEDEGIRFSLPVSSLVVFALVALLAGIVAAISPARRASRLDVLNAIQYE